ncbi:MAG: dihydroorotase [Polyangiaceae bacterium]|nr:dihydroorotase [Polyangiaceae bacterium]
MIPARDVIVLQGVRAIDPSRGLDAEGVDAVIEQGVLTRLGMGASEGFLEGERVRVIDGRGCLLLPGLVDIHVHLREPGFEGKEDIASGLRAAAAGGFTRVCPMPNTRPSNDNRLITELMIRKARDYDSVSLHPIAAITLGLKGEEITEMAELKEAGAVGVSDDGHCVTSSAVMRRALEYAATHDLVVIQHAEDHALTEGAQMHEGVVSARLGLRGWPRVAEDIIVARDLILAEYVGARYHVAHASTRGTARLLREAKARGVRTTGEVTPHHLLLTDTALLGYNTACKVNPPLREEEDVEALWEALRDGTLDAVATDHAPHTDADKDCEISEAAMGMIGLELCLPLLAEQALRGKIPLPRLIEAMTVGPARIVGLPMPALRIGEAAELILFDPRVSWRVERETLWSKSTNTPFLGRELRGAVMITIARGRVIFERGRA